MAKLGVYVDCTFDERSWNVQYLILDTGILLPGRKVIVLPSFEPVGSRREKVACVTE